MASNVERVREIHERWAQGDWTAGRDLFDEDVEFTTFDVQDEVVLHGLTEFARWFRDFLGHWRDLRQETDELIDCGDRILARGRQSAMSRASDARVEMPIYNVWVFEEGKLVEFMATRDEGVARRKAGLNAR